MAKKKKEGIINDDLPRINKLNDWYTREINSDVNVVASGHFRVHESKVSQKINTCIEWATLGVKALVKVDDLVVIKKYRFGNHSE